MMSGQIKTKGMLRKLVSFRIGEREFCLDITSVREIRGWTQTTELPQAPPHVCGVMNLRGAILSIVDLGARFGLPPAEPTVRHVIIVAQVHDQTVGLLVDAVFDIFSVPVGSIQPIPEAASSSAHSFVEGILAIDDRMISLISLDDVLPRFERIAA